MKLVIVEFNAEMTHWLQTFKRLCILYIYWYIKIISHFFNQLKTLCVKLLASADFDTFSFTQPLLTYLAQCQDSSILAYLNILCTLKAIYTISERGSWSQKWCFALEPKRRILSLSGQLTAAPCPPLVATAGGTGGSSESGWSCVGR